jgi:hypothetical protein
MPRSGAPSAPKKARDHRALVDALAGAEAKRLLAALLDAHPELLTEVAGLAEAELGAVTAEDVAEDVAFALEGLSVEDIWERAGTQPDGSYMEPTEAAWEVVGEAVTSFIADLTRRVGLGRRVEATALCQGMLLGLYRSSQEEGEFLDGHAPDTLEEAAVGAVEAWKKGSTAKAGSGPGARELAAMCRFLSDAVPEWEPFLRRTIGPTRKKGKR